MNQQGIAIAAAAFFIPIAVVVAMNIDQFRSDPNAIPQGKLLYFYSDS